MPKIRAAAARDLPAIEALVRDAYTPWLARIGATPGPLLDDYGAAIAAGHVEVLVEDGALTGLLVLIPLADALLLDNVAIAPTAQGRGLGRRLMTHAEDAARRGGYDRIRLYTHEHMTDNQAIYARLGYVETARVTERSLNRVYMEKPL